MPRKIIHCDADCFFAAIEIRDDIALRGLPIAVGGDPLRRGVISTCSYEARRFGVHSAMASAYAKKLCPQLVILPQNMMKYREAAQQLRDIFRCYADEVEPLSLDEAFLDVSQSQHCQGSATLIAEAIRARVYREVGITISAGVAPNKFLAKVASDWNKPNGLTVITPASVDAFLASLPVARIPGVGRRTLAKMHQKGIVSCADLQRLTEIELVQWIGKFGQRLYHLSRGEDPRPVCSYRLRKSMSVEHTLEHDVAPEGCYPVLQSLCQQLNNKLLAMQPQRYIAKLFVKVKFTDFTRTTVETGVDSLSLSACESLFKEGWQRYQKPVRLLGVGVRFSPISVVDEQLDFFAQTPVGDGGSK